MFKNLRTITVLTLLAAFIGSSFQPPLFAQVDPLPFMSQPGVMVNLSPVYNPAYLKGIMIHPQNAFKFDFVFYKGDKPLEGSQKKGEYAKLIKYFLASLAIPDDDQWVNLSPYEKDRIIMDDFGKTKMGRDLLAQDYMLKQVTASLIYPNDNLGKTFWNRVYVQAREQYGSTNIPVNTFNKVWILPDDALIYEKGNAAYILKNHLRVMLEEDYLSLAKHSGISTHIPAKAGTQNKNGTHSIASRIIREIVLPELQREVNEGGNFASLRQVYSGMLLAAWFKRELKRSLLGQIYVNKDKVKGFDQDPKINEVIFRQYLKAYKKGVFNFIKENTDQYSSEVTSRKYFSGGTGDFAMASKVFGHDVVNITRDETQGDQALKIGRHLDEVAEVVMSESDPAMLNMHRRMFLLGAASLGSVFWGGTGVSNGADSDNEFLDKIIEEAKRDPFINDPHSNPQYLQAITAFERMLKGNLYGDSERGSYTNLVSDGLDLQNVRSFLQRFQVNPLYKELIYSLLIKKGATILYMKNNPAFSKKLNKLSSNAEQLNDEDFKFYLSALVEEQAIGYRVVLHYLVDINNGSPIYEYMRLDQKENDPAVKKFLTLFANLLIAFDDFRANEGKDPEKKEFLLKAVVFNSILGNLGLNLQNRLKQILARQFGDEAVKKTFAWQWEDPKDLEPLGFLVQPDYLSSKDNAQLAGNSQRIINEQAHPMLFTTQAVTDKSMMTIQATPASRGQGIRAEGISDHAVISRPKAEPGGIDMNSANLSMMIKRENNDLSLPLVQQDLARLNNIEGLEPVILSIKPAIQTSLF